MLRRMLQLQSNDSVDLVLLVPSAKAGGIACSRPNSNQNVGPGSMMVSSSRDVCLLLAGVKLS